MFTTHEKAHTMESVWLLRNKTIRAEDVNLIGRVIID